jgi:hypothetical protein
VALVEDDQVDKAKKLLEVVEAQRIVVHDVSTDLTDLLDQEAAATTGATS